MSCRRVMGTNTLVRRTHDASRRATRPPSIRIACPATLERRRPWGAARRRPSSDRPGRGRRRRRLRSPPQDGRLLSGSARPSGAHRTSPSTATATPRRAVAGVDRPRRHRAGGLHRRRQRRAEPAPRRLDLRLAPDVVERVLRGRRRSGRGRSRAGATSIARRRGRPRLVAGVRPDDGRRIRHTRRRQRRRSFGTPSTARPCRWQTARAAPLGLRHCHHARREVAQACHDAADRGIAAERGATCRSVYGAKMAPSVERRRAAAAGSALGAARRGARAAVSGLPAAMQRSAKPRSSRPSFCRLVRRRASIGARRRPRAAPPPPRLGARSASRAEHRRARLRSPPRVRSRRLPPSPRRRAGRSSGATRTRVAAAFPLGRRGV